MHGKAVIVSFGQLFDVTLTENSRVARESLRGLSDSNVAADCAVIPAALSIYWWARAGICAL